MSLFSKLYTRVMNLSRTPQAAWYLTGLSLAESCFSPIPPDLMLAPMAMAKPAKAWWYAFLTSLGSLIGSVLAYILGYYFFQLIHPLIINFGYESLYQEVVRWFNTWGFWVLFFAGFTPIPYKIFTLAAGGVAMAFLPFALASLVGRGIRFYLVAGLMRWGGEPMEKLLLRYIDRITWTALIFLTTSLTIWYLYHSRFL